MTDNGTLLQLLTKHTHIYSLTLTHSSAKNKTSDGALHPVAPHQCECDIKHQQTKQMKTTYVYVQGIRIWNYTWLLLLKFPLCQLQCEYTQHQYTQIAHILPLCAIFSLVELKFRMKYKHEWHVDMCVGACAHPSEMKLHVRQQPTIFQQQQQKNRSYKRFSFCLHVKDIKCH